MDINEVNNIFSSIASNIDDELELLQKEEKFLNILKNELNITTNNSFMWNGGSKFFNQSLISKNIPNNIITDKGDNEYLSNNLNNDNNQIFQIHENLDDLNFSDVVNNNFEQACDLSLLNIKSPQTDKQNRSNSRSICASYKIKTNEETKEDKKIIKSMKTFSLREDTISRVAKIKNCKLTVSRGISKKNFNMNSNTNFSNYTNKNQLVLKKKDISIHTPKKYFQNSLASSTATTKNNFYFEDDSNYDSNIKKNKYFGVAKRINNNNKAILNKLTLSNNNTKGATYVKSVTNSHK